MSSIIKEKKEMHGLHHIVDFDGFKYAITSHYVENFCGGAYETMAFVYDEKTKEYKTGMTIKASFSLSEMIESHKDIIENLENHLEVYQLNGKFHQNYPLDLILQDDFHGAIQSSYFSEVPQIMNNLLNRFKRYDFSDNYDLEVLKDYPEQLLMIMKSCDYSEKNLKPEFLENNINMEL